MGGSLSVVGGGQKNTASDTMSVGGGEKNKAAGQTWVVGGGEENETKGGFTFIGGGEKNKCLSSFSSVGGGSENQVRQASPFSFVGGGFKNKMKGEYGFIGGGEKNQVQAKWASGLGGYKNLAKGNYATAMGQNALANQDLCMAIGLQVNAKKSVRANQVGYWVLRAERIELRAGAGKEDTLVLTKKNIKKFQNILKGKRRRRLEARSDEERILLTKLEELEDLVEYQEVEIDELEGDIQDFYRNLQEANEELFEINSD